MASYNRANFSLSRITAVFSVIVAYIKDIVRRWTRAVRRSLVRERASSRTMALHDLYIVGTILPGDGAVSLWRRWRRRWQRPALVPLTYKHTYLCYTMLLYTPFCRCRYALMPVHNAFPSHGRRLCTSSLEDLLADLIVLPITVREFFIRTCSTD